MLNTRGLRCCKIVKLEHAFGGDWTDGTMTDFKWRYRVEVMGGALVLSLSDQLSTLRKCWRNAAFRSTIRRSIAGSMLRPGDGEAAALVLAGVALIRAGAWMKPTSRCGHLTWAVDKWGDTIDFYLSPTRSAKKAAKRFLGRSARPGSTGKSLATLNTDKAPSYGAAITELKREGKLDRRPTGRNISIT